MSGTPKYCDSDVSSATQARLEEQRRRRAEEEARRRWEAEQREIRRRLENLRASVSAECQLALQRVNARAGFLYELDANRLQRQCQELMHQIHNDQQEQGLYLRESELRALDRDLAEAEARKRRDDQEKKRIAELDRLRIRIEDLKRTISNIPGQDAARFDQEGASASNQAIAATIRSIDAGDPNRAKTAAASAAEIVERHARTVHERREQWLQKRSVTSSKVEELRAHVEGLRADAVLISWHPEAVTQGEVAMAQAAAALQADRLDEPARILREAQAASAALIQDSGKRQLEAEKRDYIASSVAAVLDQMGYFSIVDSKFEEPDNPASPIRLQTRNANQQTINVSIPVSGKVFYTVGGHVMAASLSENGQQVAACDEAEKILDEMRDTVGRIYGVEMGEILWDGKGPKDVLTQHKSLPQARQARTAR